jgi:phospholipid/cholesterol/gamma-HCH transport system substrate-binding protein
MHTNQASLPTRFKVGIFTLLGLLLIGVVTVAVNDKPFWYRTCQLVHINIDDATGLKTKSPVRSLGLEIGYLDSIALAEMHVTLGICITAPVEVLPSTRAYIRGEGFLGDKFVELKPVKYTGEPRKISAAPPGHRYKPLFANHSNFVRWVLQTMGTLGGWVDPGSDAAAQEASAPDTAEPAKPAPSPRPAARRSGKDREIPVGESNQDIQALVGRVDELVNQMTSLTNNLRQAINPEELRSTMRQLNRTLENASKTLSPESGLNQTAQRSLAKLEDAIEQLRDMLTRMNKGEGSVGKLINDPTYAEDIHKAILNVNKLLTKVGDVKFIVNLGAERLTVYDGSRAWFQLGIWPARDRYYLLGMSFDPRGRVTDFNTTTTAGGQTASTSVHQVERNGILLTGMLGKVFWSRLDLAVGALHGDGCASATVRLGPNGLEDRFELRTDLYSSGTDIPLNARIGVLARPWLTLYFKAGVESVRTINDSVPLFFGAGISFEDEDIKLLFALR